MSDDDKAAQGEPVSHGFDMPPPRVFYRVWARVRDGVVAELRRVESRFGHPYGDTEDRVLDVTAVPAAPGYLVDRAGNVAPPPAAEAPAPYLPGPGEGVVLSQPTPAPAAGEPAHRTDATDAQADHPTQPALPAPDQE